jgi:hypothetical protein
MTDVAIANIRTSSRMGRRFTLRALLIVVTAICATAAQSPNRVRYVKFVDGRDDVRLRSWLPDGQAVLEKCIPNPAFFLPGLAAGLWFFWGYVERCAAGNGVKRA